MKINIGNTVLRVHPLLPFLCAAALLLGGAEPLLPMALSFLIHESGHWIAAMLLRVNIEEIELTPFGGMMRLKDLDSFPGRIAFLIALAGPLASFLGCLSAPLLASAFGFSFALRFFRSCLLILLVNLIPALPLDGGRMLRAVLNHFLPDAAAFRWLIRSGYFLGGCLCALSLLLAWRGQLSLSPAFAGCYLMYAAAMESRQRSARYLNAWIARRQKIQQGQILPVVFLAAGGELPLQKLLPRIQSGKYYLVHVLSPDGMTVLGTADEQKICSAILEDPGQPLKNCIKKAAGSE